MKAVVCLALCQEIIKRRMVGVTPLVVYRIYIIKKCRDMKPLRAAQQGGHALLFNGVLIVIDTVQRKTFLSERDSSHYAPELVQPFLRGKRMKQQGRQQRRRVVIRLHEILHRKNVEPPQRGQREIRRIGLIFTIAVPHVFDQIRRAAERRVLRRIAQEAFQRRVFLKTTNTLSVSSAVFPSESASMCASKSACGITAAGSCMASAAARYSPSILLSEGNQFSAVSGNTHAPSASCIASGAQ